MSTLVTILLVVAGVVAGVLLGTMTGVSSRARGALGMAGTNQTTTTTFGRDDVAKKVITFAGWGIIATGIVIIAGPILSSWISGQPLDSDDLQDVSKTVFNTLVPMFGTWVGTVIAFYFARENFEAAAKQTKDLVQQFGDDRLKQIFVKDVWIPVTSISALEVEADKEGDVNVQDKIRPMLNATVSRVPVWNSNKVVRYVLHESMIFRYLACRPSGENPTFTNFLKFDVGDGKQMKAVVSKFALVAQTATLADAKAKMEGTPECQDVFVTADGNEGPVLGWITNADIAKKSRT
jgi:hypothetical protein